MLRDYTRLDAFLTRIESVQHNMESTFIHEKQARVAFDILREKYGPVEKKSILDVGCGVGRDLKMFKDAGMPCCGITINQDEYTKECSNRGIPVYTYDQNFMPECWGDQDNTFHYLWSRHTLEHSPIPYFTLTEYHRVLAPGGVAYIEVPAPDTWINHEANASHHSVLGVRMWKQLMTRAGFVILESLEAAATSYLEPTGEVDDHFDKWLMFYLRKPL